MYILNWKGEKLFAIDLPNPLSSSGTWNGGLAAPTLADIDGDSNLEVIVNTANSGWWYMTCPIHPTPACYGAQAGAASPAAAPNK